ncbi:hypothetical protein GCM10027451_32870 [Geodermatophilus aquaeductus]
MEPLSQGHGLARAATGLALAPEGDVSKPGETRPPFGRCRIISGRVALVRVRCWNVGSHASTGEDN